MGGKKGYRNCERMAAHIFATAQNGIPVLPNAPSTQIVITEAIRVLHTVEASRDARETHTHSGYPPAHRVQNRFGIPVCLLLTPIAEAASPVSGTTHPTAYP